LKTRCLKDRSFGSVLTLNWRTSTKECFEPINGSFRLAGVV
jgi:hypothetical protein